MLREFCEYLVDLFATKFDTTLVPTILIPKGLSIHYKTVFKKSYFTIPLRANYSTSAETYINFFLYLEHKYYMCPWHVVGHVIL